MICEDLLIANSILAMIIMVNQYLILNLFLIRPANLEPRLGIHEEMLVSQDRTHLTYHIDH
jgi:hypothetical protein